jgi:hypothetical protein
VELVGLEVRMRVIVSCDRSDCIACCVASRQEDGSQGMVVIAAIYQWYGCAADDLSVRDDFFAPSSQPPSTSLRDLLYRYTDHDACMPTRCMAFPMKQRDR